MSKTVVLLLVLLVVAGVVYLFAYPPDWFQDLTQQAKRGAQEGLEQAAREAKGYAPAKTPEDAVKKFREAVKERDYKTAALYCTSDYAEQLRKAAPAAQPLAKSIDGLWEEMDKQNVNSDRSKALLILLEPFPRSIKFEVKEKQDARVVATIGDEVSLPKIDLRKEMMNMDQGVLQALKWGLPPEVELKPEGEGDARVWKVQFPVSKKLESAVDRLLVRHEDYVRALDQLRDAVKQGGMSKTDVERRLTSDLQGLKQ